MPRPDIESIRKLRWPLTDEQRFWNCVDIGENTDVCWKWTGKRRRRCTIYSIQTGRTWSHVE